MSTDIDKLLERLEALSGWPDAVADGLYERLTANEIGKLHDASEAMRAGIETIRELRTENEYLITDLERARATANGYVNGDEFKALLEENQALRKRCEGMENAGRDVLGDCFTPSGRPHIPSGRKIMALGQALSTYRTFIGEKGNG